MCHKAESIILSGSPTGEPVFIIIRSLVATDPSVVAVATTLFTRGSSLSVRPAARNCARYLAKCPLIKERRTLNRHMAIAFAVPTRRRTVGKVYQADYASQQ